MAGLRRIQVLGRLNALELEVFELGLWDLGHRIWIFGHRARPGAASGIDFIAPPFCAAHLMASGFTYGALPATETLLDLCMLKAEISRSSVGLQTRASWGQGFAQLGK